MDKQTQLIIVFALFCVALFVAFFSKQIVRFLEIVKIKQPAPPIPAVQFADSIQLRWNDYSWDGKTVLASWAGFQERLGPYAWESSSKTSTGEVHLSVSSSDEDKPAPPSEAQVTAFHYLRDNDQLIHERVINAIFENYPKWRDQYKDFLGDQLDEQMPVIQGPSDLKRLMGLSTVHILNDGKHGLAYVGFEFGCTWEEEHGLGVMSLGDRIIEVGSAEDAFSKPA